MLKEHPPIKLFVSISGSKFRDPAITDVAYKDIIKVKSVHFIGEKDWLKVPSEDLLTAFENPLLIRHPQGHTVPRLGGLCFCTKESFLSELELKMFTMSIYGHIFLLIIFLETNVFYDQL